MINIRTQIEQRKKYREQGLIYSKHLKTPISHKYLYLIVLEPTQQMQWLLAFLIINEHSLTIVMFFRQFYIRPFLCATVRRYIYVFKLCKIAQRLGLALLFILVSLSYSLLTLYSVIILKQNIRYKCCMKIIVSLYLAN